MSWTKCDCHGRTYVGKASTVYSTLLTGDDKAQVKSKLCPAGLSDLLGRAGRFLTSSSGYDGDGLDLFQTCGWCGEERGEKGGAAVFLTVYKHGKEREDFAGCTCDKDLAQAGQDVLIAV